jgi:hypothetical protein
MVTRLLSTDFCWCVELVCVGRLQECELMWEIAEDIRKSVFGELLIVLNCSVLSFEWK